MKHEYLRYILVPMHIARMRQEVVCYFDWYDQHRPHKGLGGTTPLEMYESVMPANLKPRYEPRNKRQPLLPAPLLTPSQDPSRVSV